MASVPTQTSSGAPTLPGIAAPDPTLDTELRHALAQKGPGYIPRTEHLDGAAPRFVNRLIRETSPYLLQHAHNPVNWSPWGDEAFARAESEGKPVLLSVGYSTCHWCHVMERESFENVEIATFINQHFVPIKVDREERPDVDEVYMRAVYLLTGRGGWPMTVILTPDRKPFFAGTYFPPFDGVRGAQRGFLSILGALSEAYQQEPTRVAEQASELSQRIQSLSEPQPPGDVPGGEAIHHAVAQLEARFDAQHGGFGGAPKFPQPARLGLLLRHHRRTGDEASRAMAEATLSHMANGGIFDHVGGGFHRYSVDRQWLVPHFEKMLYDNAQLVVAYLEAAQVSGRSDFDIVVRRTLDYVLREMTAPSGGFYSATDADSKNPEGEDEEGWFFTWTPTEISAVLDEVQAEAVQARYAVTDGGNFEGRNIFHTPVTTADIAARLGVEEQGLEAMIREANRKLYQERQKRPAPLRDDKILTGWNGLMISAFARAGLALDEDKYRTAALRAAGFVLEHMRQPPPRLLRSHLAGQSRHPAVLEDYAFLIRSLLDVYEASGRVEFFREALSLQAVQESDFAAPGGGYFMTAHGAEKLLARDKPDHDGAVPSGNSIAAENLLRLWAFTGNQRYRDGVEELFSAFSGSLSSGAAPAMLGALEGYLDTFREVVIIRGDGERELLERFRRLYLPNRVLLVLSAEEARAQQRDIPLLEGKVQIDGRVTAYVCEQGRCELPTNDPATFHEQLRVIRPLATAP